MAEETEGYYCSNDDGTRSASVVVTDKPTQTFMSFMMFQEYHAVDNGEMSRTYRNGFLAIDFEAAKTMAKSHCDISAEATSMNVAYPDLLDPENDTFGRSCHSEALEKGAQLYLNASTLTYRIFDGASEEGLELESHGAVVGVPNSAVEVTVTSENYVEIVERYTSLMEQRCGLN